MLEVEPKDTRGYFILPQAPEEAAYYTYGTPQGGAGQFAHPALMTLIFIVEWQWQAIDKRKFGIGNISLTGGATFKGHSTHLSGLEVDVRPMRRDGLRQPVEYFQKGYDRDATAKLIHLFRTNGAIALIYFNDSQIPFVSPLANHDNHFHVKLRV